MKLTSTLALVVLAGLAFCLIYFGPSPPAWLAPPRSTPPPDAGTLKVLESDWKADNLQRIEITRNEGESWLVLDKKNGQWSLPGNWPILDVPMRELIEQLTALHSRFVAIPWPEDDAAQARYGLDRPAFKVNVKALVAGEPKEYTLAIGEGQPLREDNRFYRPAYVRLRVGQRDPHPEIIRLQPELLAVLRRPREAYMKRRLFQSDPVTPEGGGDKVQRLQARSIRALDLKPAGSVSYRLERDNEEWVLKAPVLDQVDPGQRNKVLEAVPDLWAEGFVDIDPARAGVKLSTERLAALALSADLTTGQRWLSALTALAAAQATRDDNGPDRILEVTGPDGKTVTLLIGKRSGTRTRTVSSSPPPGLPMVQPMTQTVEEEYRYARLLGNDQVFEVRAARLNDVFAPPATLRDTRLARFEARDAYKVEVKQGDERTVLEKQTDSKKDAEGKWMLKPASGDAVPAEMAKVTELLDRLSGLNAAEGDILDSEDAQAQGFDKPLGTVTVWVEEEVKESTANPKPKRKKEYTFTLGKQDAAAKKLFVKVAGWPRVNRVEDGLAELVKRPAVAYRSRRLLDFDVAQARQIDVEREGKKLTLVRSANDWALTAPEKAKVDAARAGQLADGLGRLEAVEFITEAPRAEELGALYGLDKPSAVVTVEYQDDSGVQKKTLQIGKKRAGKEDHYASLAGSPRVFAVPAALVDLAQREPLSYLPQQLWDLQPEKVQSVTIKPGEAESFTVQREGAGWKLGAPFQANAQAGLVIPLIEVLAPAHAEKYEAFDAKDPKEYGLDRPAYRVSVQGRDQGSKPQVLLIGKAARDGRGRYARVGEGAGPVAVIADEVVQAIERKALEYLDPQLLSVPSTFVKKVKSQRGETAFTLENTKPDGQDWKVTQAPGVSAPFKADDHTASNLLGTLQALRAESYADYGAKVDLKKYGLDKPAAVVTIDTARKPAPDKPEEETQYVIEVGGPVEGKEGQRYGRLVDKDRPGVVVLTEQQTQVLLRDHLAYVNHLVLELNATDVQGLTRSGDAPVQLDRKDGEWQIVKPAAHRADDDILKEVVDRLALLRAVRIAEYPLKDARAFGLDKPAAEWKVRLKSGEKVLKLGNEVDKGNGERYALVGDSQAVAVLPAGVVRRLLSAPVAFRDREVHKFDDATRIVLERDPRKATFNKVDGTWKLIAPVEASVDQNEAEEFVAAVARLKVEELVAEDAKDLKPYGLDRPAARWKFQDGDKVVLDLMVGKLDETGRRAYAKLAEKPLVFLLNANQTARALGELRQKDVWPAAIDALQVERLTYKRGDETWTLEKGELGWQVRGKPEVKLASSTVNDTLAALAGLKLVRFATDKAEDLKLFLLEPPQLSVEIVLRDGTSHTLELGGIEGESKQGYARLADRTRKDVFLLSKADTARIARDVAAFTRPLPPPPLPMQGTRLDP